MYEYGIVHMHEMHIFVNSKKLECISNWEVNQSRIA